MVERDRIKPFLWTKQALQLYSNRFKRLVEKIELGNFVVKFIHRIVVTKKEVFRFNIKSDSHCIYVAGIWIL